MPKRIAENGTMPNNAGISAPLHAEGVSSPQPDHANDVVHERSTHRARGQGLQAHSSGKNSIEAFQSEGTDAGGIGDEGPPHGFFSRELDEERRQYILTVTIPVIMVILLMWMCLPVYWGSLVNATSRTSHLEAWFVNRDNGSLGEFLWHAFSNTSTPGQHLRWAKIDPQYAGSDDDIIQAVLDYKTWIAVIVAVNATSRLEAARQSGDPTYDPRAAILVYYAQARQETAVGNYVLPITTQLLTASTTAYATSSAQKYLAQMMPSGSSSVNATAVQLLTRAPQTLSPAISWTITNLRPYTSPVAQAVTLVGNIYLIIFAFVAVVAHASARSIIAPRLAFKSYLVMRIVVPFITYLPLSMSYALVNVAFHLPFDARYTYGGGFMLAFVYLYLGMVALGLALEAMITILTPKFVPFFLFILIIFNLSPTLLPEELTNPFYAYGIGFPTWNLSQAIRTIIFNTRNDLARNAGVLLGWIALSCATTLVFTVVFRQWDLQALALLLPSTGFDNRSRSTTRRSSLEKSDEETQTSPN